jgi:hypothetical protein
MTETTVFERPRISRSGACRCWPRCSRNRVSIPAGPQRRIPRILSAGGNPCRAFLGLPRNIKARLPCSAPQRSKGALMQTPFACGQGFAPTPHAPIPTGDHPNRARASAQPWPKRGPAQSVHERGPQPAARRPARGPRAAGVGTETAARSAPRTPFRYYPSTPLKKIALRANLGPLRADFPLPPRPPLPDHAGTPCRTHSRHSALWAVAPTRSRQAAPLPVRCSLGSGAFAPGCMCAVVRVSRSAPTLSDCGLPPARGAII